jgi:hypothetical protein
MLVERLDLKKCRAVGTEYFALRNPIKKMLYKESPKCNNANL